MSTLLRNKNKTFTYNNEANTEMIETKSKLEMKQLLRFHSKKLPHCEYR